MVWPLEPSGNRFGFGGPQQYPHQGYPGSLYGFPHGHGAIAPAGAPTDSKVGEFAKGLFAVALGVGVIVGAGVIVTAVVKNLFR